MESKFWNDVNHREINQLKRQKSAAEKKMQPISLSREDCVGVFQGSSGTYEATLSSCTCMDFSIRLSRKSPCKHIYRMGMEMGVFDIASGAALCGRVEKIKKKVNDLIDAQDFEGAENALHAFRADLSAK